MAKKVKSVVDKITKEKFDAVNKKYSPSSWVKFAYKYFSKNAESKNMSVKNIVVYIFIGLFLCGFFGTVFNLSNILISIVTIIYSILLVLLVGFLFAAAFANQRRLKKIINELNITAAEYNQLVEKFSSK